MGLQPYLVKFSGGTGFMPKLFRVSALPLVADINAPINGSGGSVLVRESPFHLWAFFNLFSSEVKHHRDSGL